eukprot:9334180-Lingulodinium_polyedra.AAC.1
MPRGCCLQAARHGGASGAHCRWAQRRGPRQAPVPGGARGARGSVARRASVRVAGGRARGCRQRCPSHGCGR